MCSQLEQSSSTLQGSVSNKNKKTSCYAWVRASKLTSLADEEEEPHAPCEVYHEGYGISRVAQQVDDGEESTVEPALQPARLDVLPRKQRVSGWVVSLGRATNEGRRQAPCYPDQQETRHVVEGWGVRWCNR